MVDTFQKEVPCTLCPDTFEPLFEPEEDKSAYPIYCSSCSNHLIVSRANPVRVAFREVIGLKKEALALAFQSVLAPCYCGAEFNHDSGKRCPKCLYKVEREARKTASDIELEFKSPWNISELKKFEAKFFEYIFQKVELKEENLQQLIEKFEAGEMDAETYMDGLESLRFRESAQIAVIQAWSMILGSEVVFRAAEEHELVERYGTRILVSIADALEISEGKAVLTTLTNEIKNWDGPVERELNTFIAKIGGGF
jgi:DNA-directed RNA polymerase subunit RPC12/RpoP